MIHSRLIPLTSRRMIEAPLDYYLNIKKQGEECDLGQVKSVKSLFERLDKTRIFKDDG